MSGSDEAPWELFYWPAWALLDTPMPSLAHIHVAISAVKPRRTAASAAAVGPVAPESAAPPPSPLASGPCDTAVAAAAAAGDPRPCDPTITTSLSPSLAAASTRPAAARAAAPARRLAVAVYMAAAQQHYTSYYDAVEAPLAKAHQAAIAARPRIAAYLASSRCQPWDTDSMM
ncbi:hypothetical protein TSOC_006688 [Tetrabaena socialis]|uniref:Uncharacterized protein n=1 Tax=Tetrabaena socialis TaxID=47790 RepID=A0A2J8A2Z6_9CHLO|nr:hypothetical protein TSOC_006688 [Tetrabaena socialis]|eukprot:PNH06889.1 hypothetical protein TSOC_006688 [Tetrabaena socialis]